MKLTYVTGFIACAVLLSGCYQIKENFTLNPDQSGKVSLDLVFPPAINLTGEEGKNPDETLRDSVRDLLKESSGIEVWSDVAYNLTDDGKIHFSGTAYFKDINAFELQNMGVPMPVAIKKEKDRTTYEWQVKVKKENRSSAGKPAQMSENEIKNAILKDKADYQSSKAFTSVIFTDLSVEETFVLPGEVEQITNLKKNAPNEVQFVMEGPKVMKAMEELIKDNAYLRSLVLVGRTPFEELDDRMNEKIFGEKGPVLVVVKNSAMPLFDYDAEVAAAKPKYEALMAKWYVLQEGEQYVTNFTLKSKTNKLITINANNKMWVNFQADFTNEQAKKYYKSHNYVIKLEQQDISHTSYSSVLGGGTVFKPINGKIKILVSNNSEEDVRIVISQKEVSGEDN